MRILGIDYGTARIGLALSDPTGFLAQGLSMLKNASMSKSVAAIAELAKVREVEQIVVGFPKNMNGTIGERALQCQMFAEKLHEATGLDVVLHDERLTTVSAERMLVSADVSRKKRKQVVDTVAATILLQNYLDKRSHQNS